MKKEAGKVVETSGVVRSRGSIRKGGEEPRGGVQQDMGFDPLSSGGSIIIRRLIPVKKEVRKKVGHGALSHPSLYSLGT